MNPETFVEIEPALACRLSSPELGARSAQLRQEIFAAVESQREVEHGYAFQFPGTADWLLRLADFVVSERECCPFFRFELAVEQDFGPIVFTITGPTGAKQFMDATFL